MLTAPARTWLGPSGLDDLAADGGSEVAPEGLVDLGAEPLVAEDEGGFLEKFVSIEPAFATSGLVKRRHDVVGFDLVDRRRSGRRFGSRGRTQRSAPVSLGLVPFQVGVGSSLESSEGSSSLFPNLRLAVSVDVLDFRPRLDLPDDLKLFSEGIVLNRRQ